MQVCGVKALVIFFDVKNLWYMGGKHGNKEWDFIHFLGFWNTKKASTLTWSILWSFKCIPLRKSQWCDFLELPPLDWVFFFSLYQLKLYLVWQHVCPTIYNQYSLGFVTYGQETLPFGGLGQVKRSHLRCVYQNQHYVSHAFIWKHLMYACGRYCWF